MSCIDINTLGLDNCTDCNDSNSSSACNEKNLTYFASQIFANKILSNLQLNTLNTTNKTLVGALEEIDKLILTKQDHSPQLDKLSTATGTQIEDMIQLSQVLK